jgi:hypothetical protein
MPLEIHPEYQAPKRRMVVLPWIIWFLTFFAAIVIALQLSGCASDRYLTKEQDDKMRAMCEAHGCEVVPSPVWREVEKILQHLGMIPS